MRWMPETSCSSRGVSGRGRTTILKKMHEETGGAFVNSKDFIEGSGERHPLALPETFHDRVAAALRDHKNVYVDDAGLIHDATSSCTFYPRGRYIEAALLELSERAVREGKKLVLSSHGSIASSFSARCFSANIGRYSDEDYAALFAIFLGAEQGKELDAAKIFRFAPKLTAHQIRAGMRLVEGFRLTLHRAIHRVSAFATAREQRRSWRGRQGQSSRSARCGRCNPQPRDAHRASAK